MQDDSAPIDYKAIWEEGNRVWSLRLVERLRDGVDEDELEEIGWYLGRVDDYRVRAHSGDPLLVKKAVGYMDRYVPEENQIIQTLARDPQVAINAQGQKLNLCRAD